MNLLVVIKSHVEVLTKKLSALTMRLSSFSLLFLYCKQLKMPCVIMNVNNHSYIFTLFLCKHNFLFCFVGKCLIVLMTSVQN